MAVRAIKLTVSDLHLGEGRRLPDGTFNYFEDFNEDVRFNAFLQFYEAKYSTLPIELVINGDFFDFLRRDRLGRHPDVMFEALAVQIVTASIEAHRPLVAAIRRFLEAPKNRVVCVVGESDCGLLWEKVRETVHAKISPRIEFALDTYQSDEIHFEHGHQSEAISRFPDDRFMMDPTSKIRILNLPWAAFFVSDYIIPLRKIAPHLGVVRPLYAYFVWMLLFDFVFAVRMLFRLIRVFCWNRLRFYQPGYGLFRSLRVLRESLFRTRRISAYVRSLFGTLDLKMIVMGHTHVPTYRHFPEGRVYFNTGSWTKTVSLDMNYIGSKLVLPFLLIEVMDDGNLHAELLQWMGAHHPVADFI